MLFAGGIEINKLDFIACELGDVVVSTPHLRWVQVYAIDASNMLDTPA
jgi:hypothetical protein